LIRAARFLLPCLVAGVLGAQVHGIRTADLDPTIPPCMDFFRYANGGWMRAHPVPPDRPSWGALDEMEARVGAVLREALEDAAASRAPEGSVPRQVGDFFASGMATDSVVRGGLAPLREGLARIDGMGDLAGLGRELARLHLTGARAGFEFTVGPDERRRAVNIAQLAQGGLGMPDRDDYLAEGSRGLRAAYLDYLARLFTLAGEKPALARAHAGIAFDMERRLAGVSMTLAERRDPMAACHRLSQEDLSALAPRFPWRAYFEAAGIGAREELLVRQPAFLAGLAAMAADTPAPQWRAYLKARLLDASAPFLGGAFEDASFAFHGARQPPPRWQRVAHATDAALGGALGRMYVARTFSPRSRIRAQALAAQVCVALRERIRDLPGLTPPVRMAALARLDALAVNVGYPDEWRDEPALKVDRSGYLGNVQRAAACAFRSQVALLGRPVDASRWPASSAAVKACYDARLNELYLPAGLLQPPFFDPRADDAANFGAIGVLIAHELTRDGNLPGPGGLEAAFAALQKGLEGRPRPAVDGFTPEQRFFLAYAQSRRIHAREGAVRDGVNASLAGLPEFAAAFGCGAQGPQRQPPAPPGAR